jgi:hypothetical protein
LSGKRCGVTCSHPATGSSRQPLAFTDYFKTWSGEIVTTEAVLTEAIHLLARVRGGPEACLDFLRRAVRQRGLA